MKNTLSTESTEEKSYSGTRHDFTGDSWSWSFYNTVNLGCYIYIYIYICGCVWNIYIYIYMYICIYIYIYIYMYICIYIYIYIYIYQEPITRSVHLVLCMYDGVSLFCTIFKFLYIVEDVLLLATESGGALGLILITPHCLRCNIIVNSKWGRFCSRENHNESDYF